ncbi:efflux RND transporter periplasmic adaptor subunit [Chitinophaga sp. GCM10012297]|uniref:Efflux RND transporter periplasmic adaptor subunit n=1 Tax=Chitinophaga chungangae TaxID=2821488 RepID=A0ABS3YEK9_9BACT|nr:efflux RND transporter periplasmic adaptor subunit [Chitinophaga chungangae]MBO9152559.1 efflux RND transporter periplasmic adaptor subunit [Chitinophaga chungangae]
MRNKTTRIVLLFLVLAVAGFFIYKLTAKSNNPKEPETASRGGNAGSAAAARGGAGRPIMVDAYVIAPVKLDENIEASGTLQSNEEVELKPEITGRITKIFFKEGAKVSKGTLLIKLYDGDILAQIHKLELQRQLAKTTLSRQQQLLKINGISQQDVDVTANQVSAYGADIEFNRAQLQKTEIRAPFSGTLGLRNVSEGAIVSPTTIMTTLQQLDPLKIDFASPEKYRNAIRKGDPVTFTVAGDTVKYRGNIYAIDPKIDLATRSVKIRAIVPNPSGRLFPGSFAKTTIQLKDNPNAIMIPSQAVIPGTRFKTVIVADSGKAKIVNVETGIRDENRVQITNGLQVGDTVITTGILQLKPGMPFKYNKVQ